MNAGDSAVCVEFGKKIDDAVNARVNSLHQILLKRQIKGVIESIPTFRSLLVCYDPVKLKYKKLVRILESCIAQIRVEENAEKRIVEIPVWLPPIPTLPGSILVRGVFNLGVTSLSSIPPRYGKPGKKPSI